MTIGRFSLSLAAAGVFLLALVWLILLLAAILTPVRRKGIGLRRVDGYLLLFTLLFGATWFAELLYSGRHVYHPRRRTTAKTCASIKVGLEDRKIREILGKPDEVRGAEDIRGPGAETWIYRKTRCVVHLIGDTAVSIE